MVDPQEKPEVPMTDLRITYRDLEIHHLPHCSSTGARSNAKSCLNRFLAVNGLNPSDVIGHELGHEFNAAAERYVSTVKNQANARSLLGQWRKAFLDLQRSQSLPASFADALSVAIHLRNTTPTELSRSTSLSPKTLMEWASGRKTPAASKLEDVKSLENLLELPPGTLANRIPHILRGPKKFRFGATPYRRKLMDLRLKTYRLKMTRWPQSLRDEFEQYVRFKTQLRLPRGVKRTTMWRTRGEECPTLERHLVFYTSFFGWLTLPKTTSDPHRQGKALDPKDLSLALLSDADLCIDFIEYLKLRGGSYTNDSLFIMHTTTALLREGTGYLYQNPSFAKHPLIAPKLPTADTVHGQQVHLAGDAKWQVWCRLNRDMMKSILRDIKRLRKKGRDPEEPIRPILAMQRPTFALFTLADEMEAALPPKRMTRDYSTALRDLLLVRLLTSNPLRIRMFSIMSYRQDNTGNLFQESDGSYWIRFSPDDFKNDDGAASSEYKVPVPDHLKPIIERYLKEARPHLTGSNDCDYLFRPCSRGTKSPNSTTARMNPAALSRSILKATQHFIPNCPGFSPHAFRHVIATDLIKNNPEGGIRKAAFALHDTEETVRGNYAHVRTEITHAVWLEEYEARRALHSADASADDSKIVNILQSALSKGISDVQKLLTLLRSGSII